MTAKITLSVDEAQTFMRQAAPLMSPKVIGLSKALGRVLLEPIIAVRDQPPFNASAMDGYAVAKTLSDPIFQTTPLDLVGESSAGRRFDKPIKAGQCVRVFTGAPVPEEARAVIIQEHALKADKGIVISPEGWNDPKTHIRPTGQDFKAGHELLARGKRLDPWRLSLVAASGQDKVVVSQRPKLTILSTGDELVAPGDKPRKDQVFESISYALMAMAEQWGAKARFVGIKSDRIDDILEALKHEPSDLLITIGGASVGDYDLVKPALQSLGLKIDFSSINIRPGKPTWSARLRASGKSCLKSCLCRAFSKAMDRSFSWTNTKYSNS
jgi:molybdopterin molybdotransferase